MGATAECPSCGEPVGRSDYQCPRCELVLDEGRRKGGRDRRENSVVRAMMERPRPAASQESRPKRPKRPESVSTTGPQPNLVPLDRILHVSAELRLEKLNLHPYDAWVVSLIDGRSTGEALNTKLALEPRELQALLQGLLDRGVLSLGDVATRGKKPQRASMNAPTRYVPAQGAPMESLEDDDEPGPEPTEILNREAFKKPGMPLGRDPNASIIGVPEDDDEESTVSQARRVTDRSVDRSELQRAARGGSEPKLGLPRPSTIAAPERETQLADDDLQSTEAPDPVHGSLPQETVLLGKKPTPAPKPAPVPQETVLLGKKPRTAPQPALPEPRKPAPRAKQPEPVQRPVSAPGYRPPQPASASRGVPKPTMGIEDVDAQGALQVALQMEQSGRQEEAVAYLERALERSPDAAPLYNRLAVILMRDF